jgi:hypothetical protein
MAKDLATQAKMERLLEEWRASGESAANYARAQGMTPSKFYYWKKRLEGGGSKLASSRSSSSQGLVPVRVLSSTLGHGVAGEMEVVLSGGDRLLFEEKISEETLRRVVRVLRESC